MKVLYLVDYDLNENSGVIKKIRAQASRWAEFNCDVRYLSTKNLTIYDRHLKEVYKLSALRLKLGRFGTAVNFFYNSFQALRMVKEQEFDLIYMRYTLYNPFIARLVANSKVVMEINSNDVMEYKLNSKIKYLYNKFTRVLILTKVEGFVAVSNELKEVFSSFKKPFIVIANGTDVGAIKYKTHFDNDAPQLVFISSPGQAWQGLEKVVEMSKQLPNYNFSVIGTKGNNTPNLKYHGYLENESAEKLLKASDVGVSSLALYTKGMSEASPLKSRHYLACGLPVIYAYEDTDLGKDMSFSLRLNNTPNNLDYESIKTFVNNVFNDRKISQQARKFAEDVLDFKHKEKLRVQFFNEVLSAS